MFEPIDKPRRTRRLGTVAVLAGAAGLVWVCYLEFQRNIAPLLAPPTFIQAQRPDGCRFPEEGEQLVIIVAKRDKKLILACNYVSAPGTAKRRNAGIRL